MIRQLSAKQLYAGSNPVRDSNFTFLSQLDGAIPTKNEVASSNLAEGVDYLPIGSL